jgi:hypothetical protein
MTGKVIRIILTLIVIAFIYSETGWATTLFSFLVAARFELDDYFGESS